MEARNQDADNRVHYLTEEKGLLGKTVNDLQNQLNICRGNNQRLTILMDDQENSIHIIQQENSRLGKTIADQQDQITTLHGIQSKNTVLTS